MNKPLVLTIAGSDPSGGAGIQADIRAFEAIGVYGFSVISAITVQTAEKVIKWEAISAQLFHDQLFILLENYPIKYVKCGMLPTREIIDEVIKAKIQYKFQLLVDPILYSGTGVPLVQSDIIDYFKQKLIPNCDILTPNAQEASALSNLKIEDFASVSKIFGEIAKLGVKQIVIKGGHINPESSEVVDYLYQEGGIEAFSRNRQLPQERVHGTGCIFSAILLAQLALTDDLYNAMNNTEQQIELLFRDIFAIPSKESKDNITGRILDMGISEEKNNILNQVAEVYNFIKLEPDFVKLIPEVRTNISICTEKARTVSDVAAIEGRITIINNVPYAAGPIRMGVSNHTARLLLTAHHKDPTIRAVINLKYIPPLISLIAQAGLYLFEIRRDAQPEQVRTQEQSTMQWVVENSYSVANRIPDIIWDCGEPEKEPMMRLFAKDSRELIEKISVILRVLRSYLNDHKE